MGSSRSRRAEAGIGTSIIFIAMILTSSAAGSMVLSNMDSASEQAQDAFDGSVDMAADHLDVRSMVGVCDPSRGRLIALEVLVSLGAGSSELDLSAVLVELVLNDGHAVLSHGDGFCATRVLSGGRTDSPSVIARGDVFMITLYLPKGLEGNDELRATLIPGKGFATTISLTVPDAITSKYVSLR